MLKNKKGFTLVELLAVIVILAIILAIAIPGISGIINSAKKGSFQSDAQMIVKGIEYRFLEASVDPTVVTPTVGSVLTSLDQYGANKADYTAAEITNLDPVTIRLTSSSSSPFGAWTAVATNGSVTFE